MIDAREYGRALFELAQEEGIAGAALDTLESAEKLFLENPSYATLLDTPALPSSRRRALLEQAFGACEPIVLHFMMLLCDRRSAYQLPACVRAYRTFYEESRGILRAEAVSARPMRPEQLETLREKLCAMTGREVLLSNTVDEALIGGLTLRVGGKQIDGSLRARLDDLQRRIGSRIV